MVDFVCPLPSPQPSYAYGKEKWKELRKMNKLSVTKPQTVDESPCASYIAELQAHRFFTVGRFFDLGRRKENGTELALIGSG